jgi:AcrR family transcriptional regulator
MVTNPTMGTDISRRERKKRETRQRLMVAALRLFREHGYDDTTVEKIAETADVAKSTFFNYFETKEAILPALVEWRLRQLEDTLLAEQGAPASPVARIKLALHLIAQDPLCDPVLVRRLFAAGRHRPDIRPVQALTDLLAEQVHQAQATGEIRADLDPLHLGGMIRALFFQQTMTWYCSDRSAPLREMLDATVDLLLEGIAGPKWKKSS